MKDVAREAGVALGTVSKVINHIPVGEEYRLRVEKAIQKLNYEVNTYARGLKAQKTFIIAVIIPDLINPFFSALSHYIESYLYAQGYQMILCCSYGNFHKEERYLGIVTRSQVDGIIALTYSDIAARAKNTIPLVTIDRHFDPKVPCVASDNFAGGMLAVDQLVAEGRRRPLYVRTGSVYYGETNKRKDGYMAGCDKYGILPQSLEMVDGDDTIACFEKYLKQSTAADGTLAFDSIFTVNDALAVALITYLREHHYRIPEDISVIGFDGLHDFGTGRRYCSTIVQPIEQIAKTCVEYVLREDQDSIPPLTLLPVSFSYGETTKLC